MHSIVMVALPPIQITNRNIPQKLLDKQRQTNREVLNEVLWWLLQPLTFKQNPCAGSGNFNVLCADGNFRRCKPVLAAWLAYCPEYSDLHDRKRHVCFWCECSKNDISKKHFRPDGMAASEWTHSVRAVRDTPVADYSVPGVNTTRRGVYRPPIAISPFLLVLSVSYSLWCCGQL
jgi:hypothetical protein